MLEQAKNTVTKNKWWIIGGLILAAALILYFYFAGRAAGKRKGSINLSSPISDTGSGPTQAQGAFASESEIIKLAGKLKADMTGANIWGHDLDTYTDLNALSDTDFIRVNNEFNKSYQKESGESFRTWLENESSASSYPFNIQRNSIIQRMNKLKIV